jgi:hypothetical protein
MALIEKYHVVAAERPVAIGEEIKEGQVVSLNNAGEVVLQGASAVIPYGIAGDTKSTSASAMPGIAAGWQNRVSDYYDETKASGAMTVYHSGGEFASDQFVAGVASLNPGAPLYAVSGMLSNVDTQSSGIVGRVTEPVGLLPSGVPGVDINGDIALGSEAANDTYVQFKLVI